jgi:hypothetical protein
MSALLLNYREPSERVSVRPWAVVVHLTEEQEVEHTGFDLLKSYEIECHSDIWLSLNPIEEAVGMFGADKVVVVGGR